MIDKRIIAAAVLLVHLHAAAEVRDARAKKAQTAAYIPMMDCVPDTTGGIVCPKACDHTYGYTSTNLTTDTITDGTTTWVKTYTYSGSTLTNESGWVKQ